MNPHQSTHTQTALTHKHTHAHSSIYPSTCHHLPFDNLTSLEYGPLYKSIGKVSAAAAAITTATLINMFKMRIRRLLVNAIKRRKKPCVYAVQAYGFLSNMIHCRSGIEWNKRDDFCYCVSLFFWDMLLLISCQYSHIYRFIDIFDQTISSFFDDIHHFFSST